jgi:thiamine-phosphate pyrophosphorylase
MICLVTDRTRLRRRSDGTDDLVEFVAAAARAGVDLIQIRERDLGGAGLLALAGRCLGAVSGSAAKIVINDRCDVALASAAHGVHLRADSIEPARARSLLGGRALVGRSVHTAREAADVCGSGAVDYLIFGTVFASQSKTDPGRVAPAGELAAACRAAREAGPRTVPVLAIGGMNVERAGEAARAGASGIAAIGLFLPPHGVAVETHVRTVVTSLRRVFDTCGAVP